MADDVPLISTVLKDIENASRYTIAIVRGFDTLDHTAFERIQHWFEPAKYPNINWVLDPTEEEAGFFKESIERDGTT